MDFPAFFGLFVKLQLQDNIFKTGVKKMDFTLNINMDNAAFDECPEIELARILQKITQEIITGLTYNNKIKDINGNTVGNFEIIT